MARDAKAQAKHAQKEIKANAPWIEVVKKQKRTSMDRMEMMKAKESGLAKYLFTCETIDVSSCGVYNDMLDLDPFAPLEELTQGLSNSLHKAAANAFPHTTADPSKLGRVIQNSWYDEECRDTKRCFQCKVIWRIYTHKQARTTLQHLTRKEKRS